MDGIHQLLEQGQDLGIDSTEKYLLMSAIALTLYDYLLVFDDEIRYVWKGQKTWTAYLYILNRILLVGWQIWVIYYASNPRDSKVGCVVGYYAHVLLLVFFACSSDTFIMLRVYAITSRNKPLTAYFGVLALARCATSLATIFTSTPVVMDPLAPRPTDVWGLCGFTTAPHLKLVPNSVGTAFELSAFIVIIWCTFRNERRLKFSALVRTVIKDATIYFIIMVAAQMYSLFGSSGQEFSLLTYGLYSPVLTLRFAISLKKSADPEGGQRWGLKHFSSLHFGTTTSASDIEKSGDLETIREVDPVEYHSHGRIEMREL